jgi:hypothetical protein
LVEKSAAEKADMKVDYLGTVSEKLWGLLRVEPKVCERVVYSVDTSVGEMAGQ